MNELCLTAGNVKHFNHLLMIVGKQLLIFAVLKHAQINTLIASTRSSNHVKSELSSWLLSNFSEN